MAKTPKFEFVSIFRNTVCDSKLSGSLMLTFLDYQK